MHECQFYFHFRSKSNSAKVCLIRQVNAPIFTFMSCLCPSFPPMSKFHFSYNFFDGTFLLLPLLAVILLTRCPCPPLLSPSTLSPSFKHHLSAHKLHNPTWQTSLGMDTLDFIPHRHTTKTSGRLSRTSRTSRSFIADVSHGASSGRRRKVSLAWFWTLGDNRHAWCSFLNDFRLILKWKHPHCCFVKTAVVVLSECQSPALYTSDHVMVWKCGNRKFTSTVSWLSLCNLYTKPNTSLS